MNLPLLTTKLHIPPQRAQLVTRPRLLQRLAEALRPAQKLTLVSAPAGSGKTTLVAEWVAGCGRPVAWLSLDEGDGEPARFLAYVVAALQTVVPGLGEQVAGLSQGTPPPPAEMALSLLLNEMAALPPDGRPEGMVLVLDDYHALDAPAIDRALTFFLEQLPPWLHLVLTTREDPGLPLARLRARGQLTEVRAADLRFTPAEAATFLNERMGLALTAAQVAALETRTEGWIAGLQLAALALQGPPAGRGGEEPAAFIAAFSGSHRFVIDYLLDEVWEAQPAAVQTFLLRTSVLDRLCAPLCAALLDEAPAAAREMLARLERGNLFLIPLDGERRWYRYHHLFGELLRQRLERSAPEAVPLLHRRAAAWYEEEGLLPAAFGHATAAGDVARATRLLGGEGVPLHFRGLVAPVRAWLGSLPPAVRDAQPALGVAYAEVLMLAGTAPEAVEPVLRAAEANLPPAEEATGAAADLHGRVAAIRAALAVPRNDVATILAQAQRALALLHPDNGPLRATTAWTLGYAHQVQGARAAAAAAYEEALAGSEAAGNLLITLGATTTLAQLAEADNRLRQAAAGYRRVLALAGEPPWPTACEAYAGLARIAYQWNELGEAAAHVEQSMALARQLENVDTPAAAGLVRAHLQLAQGNAEAALATLEETEQFARRHQFEQWLAPIGSARVRLALAQGEVAVARRLAEGGDLPLARARVHLAQGEPGAALALLRAARGEAEANGRADRRLEALVLQALAHHAQEEAAAALALLAEALSLAAPGGFIRLFVDEGAPMAALLQAAMKEGIGPAAYVRQLLAAVPEARPESGAPAAQLLPEPLTGREREVLGLLATELSGPEIARALTISMNTLRTHTKNIYGKLGVNSRRAAVSRAETLFGKGAG